MHPQTIHNEALSAGQSRSKPRKAAKLYRKQWPKIRKKGKWFEIDARKTGTAGKQEYRSTLREAEKRAAEIEAEFSTHGREGLALPLALRTMAIQAESMLRPFGKTIVEAAQFYKEHLTKQLEQQASATVERLASEWQQEKERQKSKMLRAETVRGIRKGASRLKAAFGPRRIGAMERADFETYLDGLDVAVQTRRNYLNLFNQFLNWTVAKGHIQRNPCDGYTIPADEKDVVIWTAEEAEQALSLCEAEFPELTLFHAIGLFAGLRPSECRLLQWRNVRVTEGEIIVLKHTSKVKETRSVPIEPTLREWLRVHAPLEPDRNALVVPPTNFSNRIKVLRSRLGYRYITRGSDGQPLNASAERAYYPDTLRHSYGSHWLQIHKDRARLAENMGNSIHVIKKHYKVLVSQPEAEKFWRVLPNSTLKAAAEAADMLTQRVFSGMRRLE